MGKLLALDIGEKRVGYAVSDTDQTMAFPRETFDAIPKEKFLIEIANLVKAEGIEKIIIGLPLDEEGEEGPAAVRIRGVGENIERTFHIPVEFVDESGSTSEALSKIPLRKQRRQKGFDDAIAAQIILERYLATRSNK